MYVIRNMIEEKHMDYLFSPKTLHGIKNLVQAFGWAVSYNTFKHPENQENNVELITQTNQLYTNWLTLFVQNQEYISAETQLVTFVQNHWKTVNDTLHELQDSLPSIDYANDRIDLTSTWYTIGTAITPAYSTFRIYSADVTPFAHAERNTNFFTTWKKHYPTQDYTDFFKKLESTQKEQLERQKERLKTYIKETQTSQSKKKEQKVQKKLDERMFLPSNVEEKAKTIYDTAKNSPVIDWREIAKQCGVTKDFARTLAVKYAYKLKDDKFVNEWQQEIS